MTTRNRRWIMVGAVVAILALLAVVAAGCEQEDTKPEPAQKTTEQDPGQPEDGTDGGAEGKIIKVDSASFDSEVLNSDTPVLVDFYADWCGPCHALHPILEELAAEYAGQVKFTQLDVDRNGDLAARYNIRSIPALYVIKNGEVVDQTIGLQGKADLKAMLDKHVG